MENRVNQSVKAEQMVNEEGRLAADWGKGECLIPVIIDMDAVDENGMIAGVSRKDLRTKRVCNRTEKVVYVRGSKELYDKVMREYSSEFKGDERDRRCLVNGRDGKLIRCPKEIVDPLTGEKKRNSCKDCPYYYSLDKQDYYMVPFADLAIVKDDGEEIEFEPGMEEMMPESDRYLKILEELIDYVSEINPLYGEIIRMKEQGVGQVDIAGKIGKSQPSVAAYLKTLRPIVEEFLENLVY